MKLDYSTVTPTDLRDDLMALIRQIDSNGYTDHRGQLVPPVKCGAVPFAIDDAKAFLERDSRGFPAIGVAFIDSVPYNEPTTRAGQELLTFVILIAVESTTSDNVTVKRAQQLLYSLQGAVHGRPTQVGREWKWAGHGLVPDDGNDACTVLQQTWQLIHSFNGYSGK